MDEVSTSIGLCLGASTVSVVQVSRPVERTPSPGSAQAHSPQVVSHITYVHDGNPKNTLIKALATIDWHNVQRVAVTGRKFRHYLDLTTIPEVQAAEMAYAHVKPDDVQCPALISAGGETFMVYLLDKQGRITNVVTGNKCAAGTGEFFLQQLRRMDVSLAEAAQWAADSEP
ncbi:MAG: hypothetical protein P8X55_20530, partial [Desulfosarcinaceae bacterium]